MQISRCQTHAMQEAVFCRWQYSVSYPILYSLLCTLLCTLLTAGQLDPVVLPYTQSMSGSPMASSVAGWAVPQSSLNQGLGHPPAGPYAKWLGRESLHQTVQPEPLLLLPPVSIRQSSAGMPIIPPLNANQSEDSHSPHVSVHGSCSQQLHIAAAPKAVRCKMYAHAPP